MKLFGLVCAVLAVSTSVEAKIMTITYKGVIADITATSFSSTYDDNGVYSEYNTVTDYGGGQNYTAIFKFDSNNTVGNGNDYVKGDIIVNGYRIYEFDNASLMVNRDHNVEASGRYEDYGSSGLYDVSANLIAHNISQLSTPNVDKNFSDVTYISGSYTRTTAGYNSQGGEYVQTIIYDFGNNGRISAIPEPTSWAMMLLGFGSLGVVLRSRRENVRTGRYQGSSV